MRFYIFNIRETKIYHQFRWNYNAIQRWISSFIPYYSRRFSYLWKEKQQVNMFGRKICKFWVRIVYELFEIDKKLTEITNFLPLSSVNASCRLRRFWQCLFDPVPARVRARETTPTLPSCEKSEAWYGYRFGDFVRKALKLLLLRYNWLGRILSDSISNTLIWK